MVEVPAFESPIVSTYASTGTPAGHESLILRDESALCKMIVRADDDTAAAAALAVSFGSSRTEGGVAVWGQRPAEWLLVGDAAAVGALVDSLDTTGHVGVIDHTHSRALFRLTGAESARLLEKVCSLDWADEMTPDGAVASASVAKVNCDLARDDSSDGRSYRVACDRSFGQYLFDALLDAGAEFGIGVGIET